VIEGVLKRDESSKGIEFGYLLSPDGFELGAGLLPGVDPELRFFALGHSLIVGLI